MIVKQPGVWISGDRACTWGKVLDNAPAVRCLAMTLAGMDFPGEVAGADGH